MSKTLPLDELFPIAGQAAGVLTCLAKTPGAIADSDSALASRIGRVSAQHVAIVRRVLTQAGYIHDNTFSKKLNERPEDLLRVADKLRGVEEYLSIHKDTDLVRLVVTEPGKNSALRREIDRKFALPLSFFQTTDAFINLARIAKRELLILVPFIDTHGANLLVDLLKMTGEGVKRTIICRPLSEEHCGPALRARSADFTQLGASFYEYAIRSTLPSGRETFHAKVVIADDTSCYIGSSNLNASSLDRSLECGVVITGNSVRYLQSLLMAMKDISTRTFL